MKYKDREISSIPLLELIQIINWLNSIEAEREKASKHPKFNQDRVVDGRMLKKMEFPSLSPQYLEMKKALTDELEKRNTNEQKWS